MGLIIGYVNLVCFLLLAGKYVTKKWKGDKADCFLRKVHKPLSCVFLLFCIIHLLCVSPVLRERNLLVTVSGCISLGIAILLIILCHTIKDGKKKMFWHRMLTMLLLAGLVLHIVLYIIDFMQYKNNIERITISNVNVGIITDGKYIGEYDAGYIYAKVQVTVKDGTISDIELLEHRNERGQKAEHIIDNIKEQQKIDVDTITSATNSSLVIEKACENALSGETVGQDIY